MIKKTRKNKPGNRVVEPDASRNILNETIYFTSSSLDSWYG